MGSGSVDLSVTDWGKSDQQRGVLLGIGQCGELVGEIKRLRDWGLVDAKSGRVRARPCFAICALGGYASVRQASMAAPQVPPHTAQSITQLVPTK